MRRIIWAQRPAVPAVQESIAAAIATALERAAILADRTAGVVGPGLADLRALVARTHGLTRFTPRLTGSTP